MMELVGKHCFKNFGIFEVWAASRNAKNSPFTFYVKANGRWVSPFERRVRKWPPIPLTLMMAYVMRRLYKDQPITQLIAQENPFLEELSFR